MKWDYKRTEDRMNIDKHYNVAQATLIVLGILMVLSIMATVTLYVVEKS